MSALPEHKVADPLLPRCANDQIRVWLTSRIQMLANEFWGQNLGEGVERSAITLVRLNDTSHGIGNLPSSAVPNRKVDVKSGLVFAAQFGLCESRNQRFWQRFGRADMLDAPIAVLREILREVADDLEQAVEFFQRAAGEIVSGQQVQGGNRDIEVVAPLEKLSILRGPGSMSVRRGVKFAQFRPASVAIDDHGDVLWKGLGSERPPQAVLIQPVKKTATERDRALVHTPTLAHDAHSVQARGSLTVKL